MSGHYGAGTPMKKPFSRPIRRWGGMPRTWFVVFGFTAVRIDGVFFKQWVAIERPIPNSVNHDGHVVDEI